MNKYSVIVGNIGEVHSGKNKKNAQTIYNLYVAKSQNGEGRASGEAVTLFENDEIAQEYIGTNGTE